MALEISRRGRSIDASLGVCSLHALSLLLENESHHRIIGEMEVLCLFFSRVIYLVHGVHTTTAAGHLPPDD